MKWPRWSRVSGLLLVLLLGVSCTTGEGAPTEPALTVSQSDVRLDIGPIFPVLLLCEPQEYVSASKRVGPEGGSLRFGRHRLEIPRGALTSRVTITAEQVTGATNSVRLSPEGLQFARPARLTLEYRNCAATGLPKRVAYTDELLRILELPSSEDYPKYDYVTGEIDHFSRYAVAY
jgi:hypothetical protein